jgi:hypothetical protein
MNATMPEIGMRVLHAGIHDYFEICDGKIRNA